MLRTNFQGHWSIVLELKIFLKVFTIYGLGSHMGHVTWTVLTYFFFLPSLDALHKIR